MIDTEVLYNRQKSLDLHIPESVAIVGAGGIGSWVAFNLALTGVKKLWIMDFDILEIHNLNRTPYTTLQVDITKVEALVEEIVKRRPDIKIYPVNAKWEDLGSFIDLIDKEVDLWIDCKDDDKPLPVPKEKLYIKLAYDGDEVTFHFNPHHKTIHVWSTVDAPNGYTVTPSWLVPPQLVANLVTYMICREMLPTEEKIVTFSVKDIVENIILGG